MSTYTFAFVIGNYSRVHNKHRRFSVLQPKWSQPSDASLALHTALSAVERYEKRLGINYTLPKLDLIAVPESEAGAMENWGLVTFEPQKLLIYPEYSSENDKYMVASTISHELAHQFFGNLDTLEWWNMLWLNEGMATFFE